MCGFAGFIDNQSKFSEARRKEICGLMVEQIGHRGPDSSGLKSIKSINAVVGFARLAIVDLSPSGDQPMQTDDGKFTFVMNGEIYNHKQIRHRLEANGETFKGTSDTEVALKLIHKLGIEQALAEFEGMFALVLIDNSNGTITMARDRFGEKPLYYAQMDGTLVFGSQLKTFYEHPLWEGVIDKNSLATFLRFGYIPSPLTIFENCKKLKPGEIIRATPNGQIEKYKFWDIESSAKKNREKAKLGISKKKIEDEIARSIKDQLNADVPVGAFLSGGIDSSLVVAIAAKKIGKKIKTFSIGFDEEEYDESKYARAVADELGVDNLIKIITPKDLISEVKNIARIYDEPFADASQVPTSILCAFAREHVKVVLSGDGGDELFAGYSRYIICRNKFLKLAKLATLSKPLSLALRFLPETFLHFGIKLVAGVSINNIRTKTSELAAGPSLSEEHLFRKVVGKFSNTNAIVPGGIEYVDEIWNGSLKSNFSDYLDRMQLIDSMTYLPDNINVKVDRASMHKALEVRAPLLNHRLFNISWRLKTEQKILGSRGKVVLRDILSNYIPKHLIERPKMGFMFPLDIWLRGELKDWADALLSPESLQEHGLFVASEIQSIWEDHKTGKQDNHYRLWCVLMFQLWFHTWKKNINVKKLKAMA